MKKIFALFTIYSLSIAGIQCSSEHADLIFINGNIVTVDASQPNVQAVAIKGEKFFAVGSNDAIKVFQGSSTEVIDLNGKTVVPGLIDGHLHFARLGADVSNIVELDDTQSKEEALALIKRRVDRLQPGQWLTGSGWHLSNWGTEEWPTAADLDRVAPDNPVSFVGMHSHASWLNSKALEAAKITKDRPDPSDGVIQRNQKTGEPTGILIENAQWIVRDVIPQSQTEPLKESIKKSIQLAHSYGFTGTHEMGSNLSTIRAYREMIADREFPFRINSYVRVWRTDEMLDSLVTAGPIIGEGGNRLTVRGVKMSIDGALGARGAAMLAPYSDEPNETGVIRVEPEQVHAILNKCLANGFTAALHAIGDRGNRIVLDAVEKALNDNPVVNHRMRVEHAQIVAIEDIPRFKEYNLAASFQWMHCTLDMPWAEKRVGSERIKGAYAWRTFIDNGIKIVGGSDEGRRAFSPFMGFHAAVTRQDKNGNPVEGWYPEQRLTRMEALKSYTTDAAYLSFEEDIVGSITVGKLADLVVLSKDIMTIPAQEILDTQADMTVFAGKIVFKRDGK